MILGKIRLGSRKPEQALVLPYLHDEKDVTRWGAIHEDLVDQARSGEAGVLLEPGVRLLGAVGEEPGPVLTVAIPEDTECHASERFRRAGAQLFRVLTRTELRQAFLVRPEEEADFDLEAFAEGFLLASYSFGEYRKVDRKTSEVGLTIRSRRTAVDRKAVSRAEGVAREVAFARDLVNRPAADLTPLDLADEARRAVAGLDGVSCKVIKGKALEKGFPSLFAVGKGSQTGPCMIQVEWNPGKKAQGHYVLCGKGITYDSGGYHVKPLQSMVLMKKDMTGAAVVLATVLAAAKRKLPVRVTALLATAENMISASSFRPGDILRSRAGKTIEIRSTDAEGRLALADALAYGNEMKPDGMIDVATLTGVAARFLGNAMAPLMGTAPELEEALVASGARTHERLISFPLLREFREAVQGKISDLRNWGEVGGHPAGTMVAGGFLSHFAGDTPWAHMDMSNCSWEKADSGYLSAGGTAFGIRVLLDFLEQVGEKKA